MTKPDDRTYRITPYPNLTVEQAEQVASTLVPGDDPTVKAYRVDRKTGLLLGQYRGEKVSVPTRLEK